MVRDLAGAVVRHIADRDAALAEGLDVHVVESHRHLHHDAALVEHGQEPVRDCPADDAVAVAPLLFGDLVVAVAELCDDSCADRFFLHRVVPTGTRPEYPDAHALSPKAVAGAAVDPTRKLAGSSASLRPFG